MTRLRSVVRLRSAVLCALLLCGLYVARHPEVLPGRLGGMRSQAAVGLPRLPVEGVLRDAEAAEAAGRFAQAARFYQIVCTQHGNEPVAEQAYLRRVRALAGAGQYEEALRAFQEFRLLYAKSAHMPEGLLQVADLQYRKGEYVEAAHTYTDLIGAMTHAQNAVVPSEDTAPPMTIGAKMRAEQGRQENEDSRAQLERLARFNQALCYEKSHNRDAALRAYDRFMSRFPQDERVAEAHFQMGALQFEADSLEAAARHFRAAWESPQAPPQFRSESVYRAGRCYQALRRRKEAIETYHLALDLRPSDDEFRQASLAELARMVEGEDPLLAVQIYRDLAVHSQRPAWRAVAQERLAGLECEATVAAAAH
jgi:TolA-binding protein